MSPMSVLILVLMEDALVPKKKETSLNVYSKSLNPCFNGRCIRTRFSTYNSAASRSLNPCFNGRCTRTMTGILYEISSKVLILVLMEDALVLQGFVDHDAVNHFGVIPFFHGSCTPTSHTRLTLHMNMIVTTFLL